MPEPMYMLIAHPRPTYSHMSAAWWPRARAATSMHGQHWDNVCLFDCGTCARSHIQLRTAQFLQKPHLQVSDIPNASFGESLGILAACLRQSLSRCGLQQPLHLLLRQGCMHTIRLGSCRCQLGHGLVARNPNRRCQVQLSQHCRQHTMLSAANKFCVLAITAVQRLINHA